MKTRKTNRDGNSSGAAVGCLSVFFGLGLCVIIGKDPFPGLMILAFVGGIIWLVVAVLKSSSPANPDKVITHHEDLLGRKITEIEDTKTGSTQTRVSNKGIFGQRRTNVYLTKKCFKCGASVTRSSDGRYNCCGRSFR